MQFIGAILVFVCSQVHARPDSGTAQEIALLKYLFEERAYNPLVRPVKNLSDIVHVQLGLAMIQLINVEEKSQIMTSNVWLRMAWYDQHLKWNKDDFGGIKVLRVSPKKVWNPDIVLYNNADGKYEVSWQPNVLIEHTGLVLWIPPAIYKSSCRIDVQFFFFDRQNCEMKFGSWTFSATQIALGWHEGKANVDLSNYWKSGVWDLVDCPGELRNISKFGVQEMQIVYSITLQRKPLFYIVNILIPCVLIAMLTVCVFYLPSDTGEKVVLSISVFAALIVFLLLVSKILPPTSTSIPLISKFLFFTFIMNVLTLFNTIIIINWNFRTPRGYRMNHVVKVLFMHYLPKLLCMKQPRHVIMEEKAKRSWQQQLPRPSTKALRQLKTSSRGFSKWKKDPMKAQQGSSEEQPYSSQAVVEWSQPSTSHWSAGRCKQSGLISSQSQMTSLSAPMKEDSAEANPWLTRQEPYLVSVPPIQKGNLRHISEQWRSADEHAHSSTTSTFPVASTSSAQVPSLREGRRHFPRLDHRMPSADEALIENRRCWSPSSSGSPNRQPLLATPQRSTGEVHRCFHEVGEYRGIKITRNLKNTVAAVNFVTAYLQMETEYMQVLEDWKYVASVIDRIQLIVFLIGTIVGSVSIIFNAPYIFDSVDQDAVIRKFSQ